MAHRILGVDPGLTRCGIGVITRGPGRQVRLVEVGVIRTEAGEPLAQRLTTVDRALQRWIARMAPDAVAVEEVFAQHNARTITGTAQVAGLAMVAATRADIPVSTHTPSEIKAAVTGNGRAPKTQVAEMVRRILGLSATPQPADAADALALAITHAWRGSSTGVGSGPRTPAQRAWAAAAAASGDGALGPGRRAPAGSTASRRRPR